MVNIKTKEAMSNVVEYNCNFCQHYRNEEIGDSDFGAVYSKHPSCSKYYDMDKETEEDIPNFDRSVKRECCEIDFWKALDVDPILIESINKEGSRGSFNKTYQLFKERYNNQTPQP